MYPIESNFKFFYKLNLGTAELDDIAFSSEGKALVEILIPFEILMPQKAGQEDHLSEKNNSDDGLHQQPATAIPNRFVDSPDSVVISPQKAALEAINEATNGEWSRAIQEIDIDTLERLLNRAKIKNRSTITDEQFEMLSNMILRKKQQTVLSNIT